jgi:hypothetical protein
VLLVGRCPIGVVRDTSAHEFVCTSAIFDEAIFVLH